MNRIDIHHLILRMGQFIQSLSMLVLKPDDLVRLSRRLYCQNSTIEGYSDNALLDSGLSQEERALFDQIPVEKGCVLVLGIGGGRDVIGIAQKGHDVYGVDYVPKMVSAALKNAAARGLRFTGIVQDIDKLAFRTRSFDVIFFSTAMYSCVPTKKRRKAMLQRVYDILKPDGHVVCQYYWKNKKNFRTILEVMKKLTGYLTWGYMGYETGDFLKGNAEFIHAFYDPDILVSEFREAGFIPIDISIFQNGFFGGALLRKAKNEE